MFLVLDDENYVEKVLKSAFPNREIVHTRTSRQFIEKLRSFKDIRAAVVDQYIEHGSYPESEFLSDSPEYEGFSVAVEARKLRPDVPVFLLTRFAESSIFMRAYQYGIIPIEFVDEKLTAKILRERILRTDPEIMRELVKEYRKLGWVAESPKSRELIWEIEHNYKDSDEPLLITGEIGVGKTLLAKIIHNRSKRANSPVMTFVISAYPRENLYYMLFGAAPRAFTGVKGGPGLVETVGEGTLILDEIGDLPIEVQLHLHTLLEERRFRRMQESKDRVFKGRIIVLTHKNLKNLVKQNLFRDDLLSRISGLHIHIPPLRERREDIKPLLEFYCDKMEFTDRAMELLVNEYPYPANVRSLKKICQFLRHESKDRLVTLDIAIKALTHYEQDEPQHENGLSFERILDWMLENGITLKTLRDSIVKAGYEKLGKTWNEEWEKLGLTKATFYRMLKSDK